MFSYKYFNFVAKNINILFDSSIALHELSLPLGISFFTLQQISYLIDVRKKILVRPPLIKYAIYVTFFPQLIAGPIVRFNEIARFLDRTKKNVKKIQANLSKGVSFFALGLLYKVIVADYIMRPWAQSLFSASFSGIPVSFIDSWIGTLAYSFQLYFDFAGYSYMAIGLGHMFGIPLPINFNSPYSSTSIIDFWRKWHMTLSRFLRDYLYIPLGGRSEKRYSMYRNLLIVMLIAGVWHGSGWNFLIWGLYHGALLVLNHYLRAFFPKTQINLIGKILFKFTTFFLVMVGWVIFRAEDLESAFNVYRGLLGINGIVFPESLQNVFSLYGLSRYFLFSDFPTLIVDKKVAIFSFLLAIFYTFNEKNLHYFLRKTAVYLYKKKKQSLNLYFAFILSVIIFVSSILIIHGESEFLYFQF